MTATPATSFTQLARFGVAMLAAWCLAGPALADSSTSSASSAGSASSGSVSDSLGTSSDSSKEDKVAAGEYRVVDVAGAAGRPGTTRLQLRATAPGAQGEVVLYVPDAALGPRPLGAGDLVLTKVRPYGYEFAHADTRQAFFLALHDDWQRDTRARPVAL